MNQLTKWLEGKILPISFIYLDQLHEYNKTEIDEKLQADIKKNGIKEPIKIVRQTDGESPTFRVIDGKHRCVIAKQLGIKILPCKII